jgi:methylmalonyl-CoA/ethylmalonyl-CoA epimerase
MYEDLFGYRLRSGPFTDPIQRVAVCFLERGEAIEPAIELVAPLAEESPIKSVLLKGGGAYHICFETSDIERTLAEVTGKACVIVSRPVPAVAFGGRRIAWFFTPTRQLVELVETADNTIGIAGSPEEGVQ